MKLLLVIDESGDVKEFVTVEQVALWAYNRRLLRLQRDNWEVPTRQHVGRLLNATVWSHGGEVRMVAH